MFVITERLLGLESSETLYINPGVNCRMIGAHTVLNEAVDTGADVTLTFTDDDASNTIGVLTIEDASSAAADIDEITFDTTTKGAVALGPATSMKIVTNGGGSSTGELTLTMVFDEYHAA